MQEFCTSRSVEGGEDQLSPSTRLGLISYRYFFVPVSNIHKVIKLVKNFETKGFASLQEGERTAISLNSSSTIFFSSFVNIFFRYFGIQTKRYLISFTACFVLLIALRQLYHAYRASDRKAFISTLTGGVFSPNFYG